MSDGAPQWEPGPRLSGRVSTSSVEPAAAARRDPRWLAVAILVAAAAIAASLWIAALWLQSNDGVDEEPEANDESALSILHVEMHTVSHATISDGSGSHA